jgi:carbonic anhydrase
MTEIKNNSAVLNDMITAGKLKIIGAMYDIESGILTFL